MDKPTPENKPACTEADRRANRNSWMKLGATVAFIGAGLTCIYKGFNPMTDIDLNEAQIGLQNSVLNYLAGEKARTREATIASRDSKPPFDFDNWSSDQLNAFEDWVQENPAENITMLAIGTMGTFLLVGAGLRKIPSVQISAAPFRITVNRGPTLP